MWIDNTTTPEAIVVMSLSACLFFLYGFVTIAIRYRIMRRWRTVQGCVIKHGRHIQDRDRGPFALYEYSVDGRDYEGRRVTAVDAFPLYRGTAHATCRTLQATQAVSVYVSPDCPRASCIDRTADGATLFKFAGSCVVMLGSAAWAARGVEILWPLVAMAVLFASLGALAEAWLCWGAAKRSRAARI